MVSSGVGKRPKAGNFSAIANITEICIIRLHLPLTLRPLRRNPL
ncbi:hypothetical protein [Nostoc sp. PA-18-2419]|nr:hypothetical protein [Nostoc sp. PA-18-2419]